MRPDIWIGHVDLRTSKLDESEAFMKEIGLRAIFRNENIAVLELRGGTHLILIGDEETEGTEADFDFMVEDLDSTHESFKSNGFTVSSISHGDIHDSFTVTEPGGNRIKVNSTHVEDHSLV